MRYNFIIFLLVFSKKGLDPALHVFQIPNFENKIFLGKDNASFVDVIHCNLGGYGVNWNCGDVDFYRMKYYL